MNTYYFVRHAHADWTPGEERPLSTKGQKDAQKVAEVLASFPITLIYSSPFRRASQTVLPLSERLNIPIEYDPNLRERKLCEGEIDNFFDAVEATWRDFGYSHPGGESNAAAQIRGEHFISNIQHQYQNEHIVIATHGNLMALTMQLLDPIINFDFWKSLSMPDIYMLKEDSEQGLQIHRLWNRPD